jgi:hypothetical protein
MIWWLAACLLQPTGDLQTDLQRMCDLAERIEADRPNASDRLNRLAQEAVRAKIGPAGLALLEAIRAAPPAARRKVVQEVLDQYGVPDLKCPALREILLGS